MFTMFFVEDDALHSVEVLAREGETLAETKSRANKQYAELRRPGVTELIPYTQTVDVQFVRGGQTYTYFCNVPLTGYSKVRGVRGVDGAFYTVDIISSKLRTVAELKQIAKSKGFRYEDYKVLHGIAVP